MIFCLDSPHLGAYCQQLAFDKSDGVKGTSFAVWLAAAFQRCDVPTRDTNWQCRKGDQCMSQQPLKFTRKTKRGISRKKELMFTVLSTKLWVADHWLFEQERIRKHVKAAVLLRDIVHQWAVRKRLAPDAPETLEETATIALLREIKTELLETRDELRTLQKQVLEMAKSQGDWLELNDNQLTELTALSRAHYNVSAQTFSVVWTIVEWVREYVVRPAITSGPQFIAEAYQTAGVDREIKRTDGLEMVQAMAEQFHSPQPVEMVLIQPPSK
jgi:hypothetical protein